MVADSSLGCNLVFIYLLAFRLFLFFIMLRSLVSVSSGPDSPRRFQCIFCLLKKNKNGWMFLFICGEGVLLLISQTNYGTIDIKL
jgi:hypothetical protein